MNAPGKETDKKKALGTTLRKMTECDSDDLYVDLSITCIRKGDETATILAGVPPVRIYFWDIFSSFKNLIYTSK